MVCLWVFIGAVTLYDCWFALAHADTFGEWEENPLARRLGPVPAVVFRLTTVVLAAAAVRWTTPNWRWVATLLLAAAHFGLVCVYCSGGGE